MRESASLVPLPGCEGSGQIHFPPGQDLIQSSQSASRIKNVPLSSESTEDWTFLLRKTRTVTIPEAYPVTVPITALAFSPDGQQIAASSYHEITFWKTADGVLDHRVAGLSERTYGIVYSGDGRWLATASGDPGQYGLVRLWSLGKGGVKPVRDLAESQDAVFAVARLQPRRQAAGHRRRRPDHSGLR